MKIIIEIKEVRPGQVVTTIEGVGVATPLENKMVDHVTAALDVALKNTPNGTASGRLESRATPLANG